MFDPDNISDDELEKQKQSSPGYRSSSVPDRYRDSYRAANTMIRSGTIMKVLGSIACIGSVSVGILLIGLTGVAGFFQVFGILEFCLIVGVLLYSAGLLISGQGYILRISVDRTINTSHLSHLNKKGR